MKSRELKSIDNFQCPLYLKFGKSRNWGAHFFKGRNRRIELYLWGMTPGKLYETLEHEIYHEILFQIKQSENIKFNIHQEHWLIDMMLDAHDDWI